MRCHVDASTLRLRDGSLMRSMRLAGFPFETEDDEVLNHLLAVRDVVLRSALNSKAVLYHHLIRRRVEVDLGARNPDRFLGRHRPPLDRPAQPGPAVPQRAVPDDRHPSAARQGRPSGAAEQARLKADATALTGGEALELDSATAALSAALQSYGVRVLGTYETETGIYSEPLELLSALYNGEMRPVLMPRPEQDLGQHIPYSRVSFGLDAIEVRGPAQPRLRQHPRHQGISGRQPRRPARFAAARSARAGDHRKLRADRAPDGARADRPCRFAACAAPTKAPRPSAPKCSPRAMRSAPAS